MPTAPPPPRLLLLHDAELRTLVGIEPGRVFDDQPAGCRVALGGGVLHLLDRPGGRVVGFAVDALDRFEPGADAVSRGRDGPLFHVPALSLAAATVGEIVLAARHRYGEEDSLAVRLFARAVDARGEEALAAWRDCLDAGDGRAHFALGYTLCDLGRPHEGYAHLRHAARIGPAGAWNWCWLGDAAAAIGAVHEARAAYRRAVRTATDATAAARELALRGLLRLPPPPCKPSPTPSTPPSMVPRDASA